MTTDAPFVGFQSPTSNTTYTPNQFFDVVLSTASRGVVRLVAYMIRQTLGWSDAEGRPQEAHITISYRELETQAGIAQSKIRAVLDEAIAARFIKCVRPGQSHVSGTQGVAALYELCWDERDIYITDQAAFQGFYAGNGNLTYIPNEFFDVLIPQETLAVTKVVGAIIRHTIGFQTRYGLRRQQIAISFTELQRKTGIVSRRSLNEALHTALERHYLQVIESGYFDPHAGQHSRAATYGVRWRDLAPPATAQAPAASTEAVLPYNKTNTSKRIPEERLQKDTGGTPPKGYRERLQKDTGNASKRIPGTPPKGYRYTNNSLNNSLNQQQPLSSGQEEIAVVESGNVEVEKDLLEALQQHGFDARTALSLAERFSADRIHQQLRWLPLRAVHRNRLGLLRRAIEDNWPAPEGTIAEEPAGAGSTPAYHFARYFYAGLAGNPDEPVASPSASDLAAARPYVARLLTLWPEEAQAAIWGRAFGAFVQTSEQHNGKLPRSLSGALRVCGDVYYREFLAQRQRETRQATALDRHRHETHFRAMYEAYMAERETYLQREQPAQWAAFMQQESSERQALQASAGMTGALARIQLRAFDALGQQRERLCRFFRDDTAAGMFDFWEWDAHCNPQRRNSTR